MDQLEERSRRHVLHSSLNYTYRRLQEYLKSDDTWGASHAGVLPCLVVYFWPNLGCTNRYRFTRAAWGSWPAIISRVPAIWACPWWAWGCSTMRIFPSASDCRRLAERGLSRS